MDLPPAPELSSAERKLYRGRAMNLKPAVMIGRSGITPSVVDAVHNALQRDGLIKIRIEAPDKETRRHWLLAVSTATHAAVCGEVGHTASLYRPKPKQS
jgi:RNA-binding protein